jgi:Gpi18-like mannosyltransferase
MAAALRICFGAVAIAAVHLAPRAGNVHGQWEELVIRGGEPWSELLSTWQRWDALWYEHIAQAGYRAGDGSTAFFPLFPFLSRVLSIPLGGEIVLAGLLVSTIAFGAAMWLLMRLTRRDAPPGRPVELPVPPLVALATALFPTGFFLLAPYTESLFLALSVSAFWFARTDRPWHAAVAACFASLTRPQGAFLALPLAAEYVRQRDLGPWLRGAPGPRPGIAALAPSLPGLGAIVATFVLPLLSGQRGSPLDVASYWGYAIVPPWDALAASWRHILAGGEHGNLAEIEALNLVSLLGFGALAIVAIRRLPLSYSLYALPSIALLYTRTTYFSPLSSDARYVLVLFPCFMILGTWLARSKALAISWLAVSALLEILLLQFWARWGFVG